MKTHTFLFLSINKKWNQIQNCSVVLASSLKDKKLIQKSSHFFLIKKVPPPKKPEIFKVLMSWSLSARLLLAQQRKAIPILSFHFRTWRQLAWWDVVYLSNILSFLFLTWRQLARWDVVYLSSCQTVFPSISSIEWILCLAVKVFSSYILWRLKCFRPLNWKFNIKRSFFQVW